MGKRRIRLWRGSRPILKAMLAAAVFLVWVKAWSAVVLPRLSGVIELPEPSAVIREMGEFVFWQIWDRFYPDPEPGRREPEQAVCGDPDPAYRAAKAAEAFWREHAYLAVYGNEETSLNEAPWDPADSAEEGQAGSAAAGSQEAVVPGQIYQLAQLEDYDFLMSHFYSVHTSTTAGRDLMDARKLLSRNFQLDQEDRDDSSYQILIYHTHSQEAFADSKEGENIVAVGDYLAKLLTQKGFSVYHDRTVYDVRDGKLDRNRAYTYALEGISRILEENPSIQVVIDLHRDGVGEKTRLVTEINGKPTAQIMFFNGMSQTPDGPVPYLENPNREDNLAFSLQLQLKAAAYYPGFTRKIYLKGLRYNLHLRPCSCLIEAGAQTNTYQEVKNAMEPLAEVFTMVLRGK